MSKINGNGRSHPERQEFEEELILHIPSLRKFCRNLTRSPDAGDDVAQEALLRAFKFRDRFVGGSFKAWLFTIARNEWKAHYRHSRAYVNWDPELLEKVLTTDMGLWMGNEEQLHHLLRCLNSLPQGQREAVLAVSYDEISYKDAAKQFGCPVGTIKSRVSRGRHELRQLMEN